MWKKGEIVWVNLSDTWIPGQILDRLEPVGILVSFFGLMEPRYVPKPCLRSFERDFGTLIADSRSLRRFVNRALRAHFWNISFGLWCSCQPPIDSPYFDRENSLPLFPLTMDPALGFVRDMAISVQVPLRKLAEINSSTTQILSFRRYTVDFKRSETVYKEVRESAQLMHQSEEPDWYLDPSNKLDCIDLIPMFPETVYPDVEHSRKLSLRDPFPNDIHCCSSGQPVGKVVHVYTWNTRNPLTNSDSIIMKACETMARTTHEDNSHPSNSREHCQVEQSICLLNAEPAIEDVTKEDIIGVDGRTVTSAKQSSPVVNVSSDKVCLAKRVSFLDPEASETLACSVKETYAKPRNKPDGSMISAKILNEESSDMNTFSGPRENCSDDALESHNAEVGQVSLHITGTLNREYSSNDNAEQLQDLDAVATVTNKTRPVDNVKSIGTKRKASQKKAFADSKRKKKAGQQSVSTDKPLNLHMFKDIRLAEPKCLRMKFSSRHGKVPSKAELLKRFSVFGKLDPSRTDVNRENSSAKVVFLQSIDAVTAYQFARSKKFTLGRSKVTFQLDPFEGNSVINKVPMSEKPQKSVPSPKSCLKEHDSAGKVERRRNLKVKFRMETNT